MPGQKLQTAELTDERAFLAAVLRDEAAAVAQLADRVGPEFHQALDIIEHCTKAGGTVLVSGLGKSGLVGAKISATLASLGIPSHSVHPAEAAHGDLGRFRSTDAVLALSYSGETDEVVNLCAILRQDNIPVIAITRGENGDHIPSSLERLATVTLAIGEMDEAGDGHYAAPTCSTAATLAIGDAIALAAARRRQFTNEDFAKRHPGGSLGGLLRPITEVLRFRADDNLPTIADDVTVSQALDRAAQIGRRPGAILLVEPKTGTLTGIFTDGDLRRLVLRDTKDLDRPVRDVMTKSPHTLSSAALVKDAVKMVREFRQDEIPVVDDQGRPVGILDVQDLIAMKLVRD